MNTYRGLAAVYDHLVVGVDFGQWIDYVESLLNHFGFKAASVLDLACGTGNTLLPFAMRGYRSQGVDISPEMIAVAREKALSAAAEVEYHVGDITEFLLEQPVELVTCFHDGLNYIVDPDRLKKVFENSYKNICSGGMFVFDMNAVIRIGVVGGGAEVIDEDGMTIIYRTSHDIDRSLWTVDLTCFLREGEIYHKFTETHRERGYSPHEVEGILKEAGFMPLAVYDAFSFNPPDQGSRRHFYVARRP